MTSERTRPGSRKPRIAILGTGKMGSAIALRLAAEGFEITLWNRTRARAERLGVGSVAGTPAAATAAADVVISSLTGPDAIRAAYLGPAGALSAGGGKLFVEMSTAGTQIVSELSPAVAAAGARLLDAPILGAPPLVAEGKAAVVVGGSESDVEIARPILENFGTVRHVGPLGRGARLKLVANSMLATVVLAAAELQAAGERAGLEPVEVFWVLERMAPVLGPRRHGFIENRHEPALFAVRDLYKDLDLATGLFADVGARTPLTGLARELFAAALASAPGMDITAVARPYREPTASTAAR